MAKYSYSVLGISSGLGVSLYPFRDHVIGNIEYRSVFHTPGNEQWNLNFPGIPLKKKLPNIWTYQTPDVIISSPDCGSGSILRYSRSKKLGDHKENVSLDLFFKGIEYHKPKLFYFENLDGLFKSFPKEEFQERLSKYRLIIHSESVSKWGNSQINRKRLVIIGIRKDLPQKLKKYFKLPHYEEKIMDCMALYGDLPKREVPEICHVRESLSENISIHARRKMTLAQIQKEWENRLHGKKRWTVEGGSFSTAPGVYRNLADDKPATARKANRQFDHLGLTLTPRQLARVQGVPDEFALYYDDTKKKYCINKARCVLTKSPPMEISIWFKRKLEKSYKLWQSL